MKRVLAVLMAVFTLTAIAARAADSTKINRSSFTRLGTLDVIHAFITDDGIRDEDARAFETRGVEVIIAR